MFLILITVIVLLKVLTYLWSKRKLIQLYRKLKNDIVAYPIIGHGYLLMGSGEDRMNSCKRLGWQAIKHDGLARLVVLNTIGTVVGDADIADVIMKHCLDKGDIIKITHSLLGNGSIFADVPIWRPRRKALAPAFALKNLNDFVTIFDKNSRELADQLAAVAGCGDFSLWKYVAAYTMDSVCESTLDFRVDAFSNPNQPYLHAFDEYCRIFSIRFCSPWLHNETVFSNLPWYRKFKDHIKYMHDFIDEIIRAKRKALKLEAENKDDKEAEKPLMTTESNGNDSSGPRRRTLLELLVSPAGGGAGCTDEELREELLVITLAGTDTSATGIAFVLVMLSWHQDVQDKACNEMHEIFGHSDRSVQPEDLTRMHYLDAVMKETLRLYPPVPVILRKADKDVVLPSGLVLPKDTDIFLNLWAILRNPRHWGPNAEHFDPARFLNEEDVRPPASFSVFSYGPRKCIGYQYAWMSMKTAVSSILRRYRILPRRDWNPDQPSLRLKLGVMMKDVDNFIVRLEKRI